MENDKIKRDADGNPVLDDQGNTIPLEQTNDGGGSQQQTPPPTPPAPPVHTDTPPPPPAGEKKKVEVDADVLERLVGGYESLQQKVKDLEGAADIGRLARIQALRAEGKLVKNAKLSLYEGAVVLGWVTVKDDVYTDERGVIHEDQQIALYIDDGKDEHGKQKTKKTDAISYRTFARVVTKIEGEVVREIKDSDGRMVYGIRLEDGREYDLPITFIN